MAVVLPEGKVPKRLIDPRVLVLYAAPKVGKTTIIAELPNALILDLEEGTDMIDAPKVTVIGLKRYPFDPPETPEQVNARHAEGKYYLSEVIVAIRERQAQGKTYDFLIPDTVTRLEEWCEFDATVAYMTSPTGVRFNRWKAEDQAANAANIEGHLKPRNLWEPVTRLPKGAGYQFLRESYEKWVGYLRPLCKHLILIGHVRLVTQVNKVGEEVDAKDLDLTGKIRSMTTQKIADAMGFVYRKESENYISFKSVDEVAGGSRAPHLEGRDILISKKLDDGRIEVYWQNIFKGLEGK